MAAGFRWEQAHFPTPALCQRAGQAKCMLRCEIKTDGRADATLSSFQLPAPAVPGQECTAHAGMKSLGPSEFIIRKLLSDLVFLLIWVCVKAVCKEAGP